MNVECIWPGSVHDAKVFANSSVNKKIKDNTMPRILYDLIPGYEAVPNYLIGDPAYPLTSHLMKEYMHCNNNEEVIFNNMLRSARKNRWGFLSRKVDLKLENIPTVIYTCFILHNYCENLSMNDPFTKDEIELYISQQRKEDEEFPNKPDPLYTGNTGEGEYVRSLLTKYIRDNLPDNYV